MSYAVLDEAFLTEEEKGNGTASSDDGACSGDEGVGVAVAVETLYTPVTPGVVQVDVNEDVGLNLDGEAAWPMNSVSPHYALLEVAAADNTSTSHWRTTSVNERLQGGKTGVSSF